MWKPILFRLVPSLIAANLLVLFYLWYAATRMPEGLALNRLSWEKSFVERGTSIPPHGPRDWYWSFRIGRKQPDEQLGWREPRTFVDGLLDVDDQGLQHVRLSKDPVCRVLILGGSVAFGSYASAIETTYFHRLAERLERESLPAQITVLAAGAWRSAQEVALETRGEAQRPDLVLFLNGLNDLTVGANASVPLDGPVDAGDDSLWTVSYHAHDYEVRVAEYLANMGRAAQWAADHQVPMLVVLQPALVERSRPTNIERALLQASISPHKSAQALRSSYEAMRRGLRDLARTHGIHVLDCSRAFDDARETTFSDFWHFADAGHELLARKISPEVVSMLRGRVADRTARKAQSDQEPRP